MLSRCFGVIGTVICIAGMANAQVVVNCNTKNEDTIGGDYSFRATVQSQSLVSQVEFYVNDDLFATDDSTPYEFTLDTLKFDDGPIKVSIAAYNEEGESQKLELNLKIDNGLSKGVDYHIEIAEEALTQQRWDSAISASRIALKIEPESNTARMSIARAYFGKGTFDLAQKYAEDVVNSEPDNLNARELLAGINLKQAFDSMSATIDRASSIEILGDALKSAARGRREINARRMDNFGPVNDDNRMQYMDLLIASGRFSLVITELDAKSDSMFKKNAGDSEIANRLIYAQIRAGRLEDAVRSVTLHARAGYPDAYGYALASVVWNWFGDDEKAGDAEIEALLEDPSDPGVQTAKAFVALRKNRISILANNIGDFSDATGFSPITNYYLSALYFKLNNFTEADKAFKAGLLADPAMHEIYIERFNQSITYYLTENLTGADKQFQFDFARAFVEGALAAKPDAFDALTALAILSMMEDDWDDAVLFAQAAANAAPQYAAAHYVLAGAAFGAGRVDQGSRAMAKAIELDSHLSGLSAPSTNTAWAYFYQRGRIPLLTPPGG